jgi:hypothetical protein
MPVPSFDVKRLVVERHAVKRLALFASQYSAHQCDLLRIKRRNRAQAA